MDEKSAFRSLTSTVGFAQSHRGKRALYVKVMTSGPRIGLPLGDYRRVIAAGIEKRW
jgi:hypothetical protein